MWPHDSRKEEDVAGGATGGKGGLRGSPKKDLPIPAVSAVTSVKTIQKYYSSSCLEVEAGLK